MNFLSSLALAGGLVLGCAWLIRLWRIERMLDAVGARQQRLDAVLRDRARQAEALQELFRLQQQAERNIDQGLAAAKAIHQSAAGLALNLLDALPETREAAGRLREVHERVSRDLGNAAGALNRAVGVAAREALVKAVKSAAEKAARDIGEAPKNEDQ